MSGEPNEFELVLQYLDRKVPEYTTADALRDLLVILARREREEQAEAQKMVGG